MADYGEVFVGSDTSKLRNADVDVFVAPAPDRTFGFLPFMDAYAAIQKVFGDQVEIGYSTRTGLSPYILEAVGAVSGSS